MHTKVIQNNKNHTPRFIKHTFSLKNHTFHFTNHTFFKHYIRNSRTLTITGLTSTLLLSLLILTIYQPLYYHGKNEQKVIATTGSSIQATTSLSITTASNVAGVDLLVKDNNGTFASSDDDNLLQYTVTTDNYTGYTLTISGKDDNGLLTNNDDNCISNCTLSSIPSSLSTDSFNTTTYNGTWGYKPNKLNSSDNTNYLPSPTTTATTLDKTATANTTTKEYTIGIGARATYTQQAGVYSNTYILQAVGNPINYAITYSDASGDSAVADLPVTTSGSTSATSITLSSDTPTRAGYEFKGWCSVNNGSDTSDCKDSNGNTGTIYQPGATYGIDQTTTNITTLYAIWDQTIYMQDLSLSACQKNVGLNGNAANVGDNIKVYDRRDGNDYTVRYINGSCWMTQNLRFLGNTGSAAGKMTLTSDTSNGAAATIDLYSLASTQNATNANLGAYNSHCDSTNGYNYACVYDSGNNTTGVWYNYNAATAGNIKTDSNSTTVSANGPSVCPAGWHLPTGPFSKSGTDGYTIFQNTSYQSWIATNDSLAAFNAVAGGVYGYGSLYVESNGVWWSATAYNTTNRYYLGYNSSNSQFLGSSDYRYSGYFVRCVKDTEIYMQDVTTDELSNLMENNGDSTILYDRRDNNNYTIAKIDDAYWMTQNLRITHTAGQDEGTILGTDSDFSGESITFDADLTAGNSYWDARYHDPTAADLSASGLSATQVGVWYNFCAAAAKSGTGACDAWDSYSGTESICPSGWRLPTYNKTPGALNDVAGAVTVGDTNGASIFNPVRGGIWDSGSLSGATTGGVWWSSTADGANNQYRLYYNSNNNELGVGGYNKSHGYYVRCVKTPPIYTLTFDGNGGVGAPGEQTGSTITIPSATPTYHTASTVNTSTIYAAFKNWNTAPDGSGISYAANSPITLSEDTILYAQWNFDSGTLQNADSACGNDMIDARTGVTYHTATISNQCYMEQNLYLEKDFTLYAGDSNIYNTIADKNKKTTYTINEDLAVGDNSYTVAEMHVGDFSGTSYRRSGAWYNYCAASAGTVCDGNTDEDAYTDICPKGWKLPARAELASVKSADRGGWKFTAGWYYGGSLQSASLDSYWWSSTKWGAATGYHQYAMLYANDGNFYVSSGIKRNGYFVRCVRTS